MDYVNYKITAITASSFLCAAMFVCGAFYIFWKQTDAWQVTFPLCGLIAIGIALFPVSWMIWPHRHPVRRSLARWGDVDAFARRLNAEMAAPHHVYGPFHFTATLLIYDPGYTLEVVPFDQILSAQHVHETGVDGTDLIEVLAPSGPSISGTVHGFRAALIRARCSRRSATLPACPLPLRELFEGRSARN